MATTDLLVKNVTSFINSQGANPTNYFSSLTHNFSIFNIKLVNTFLVTNIQAFERKSENEEKQDLLHWLIIITFFNEDFPDQTFDVVIRSSTNDGHNPTLEQIVHNRNSLEEQIHFRTTETCHNFSIFHR